MADIGQLKVQCFRGESAVPIDNCRVTINPTTSDQVQNINALGNKTTSPVSYTHLDVYKRQRLY